MKHPVVVIGCIALTSAGLAWLTLRDNPKEVLKPSADAFPVTAHRAAHPSSPLPKEDIELGVSAASGEEHTVALNLIMGWINGQQILTAEDRDILLAYLSQSKPVSLKSGEWEERVNEILNLLRAQPGEFPGLADLLLHMAGKDPNPVLRMYALQHIAMWIPHEPSPAHREAMIAFLTRLAEAPGDPLAGSAVLFLNDLHRSGDLPTEMVAREVIERAALRLTSDASGRPDVRISALHTCTERGMRAALPAAREIAGNGSLMIPLRKAAIHCIGEIGTSEDEELLESVAAAAPVLRPATTPALQRLRR